MIGVALGLSVQTLLSTAAAGGVLLLVAIAYRRVFTPIVAAAAVTFFTAPLYYAIRGSWAEFWSGWWVQARNMSVGTGRSLGGQLALGLHQFGDYYQRRPLAFLIVAAFLMITVIQWATSDRRFRLLHGGLLGWFVAAWIELALSQRYSSHYFVVSTVPTGLMAAALAGYAYRAVMVTRRRPLAGAVAWPLLAVVSAVFLSGTDNAMNAARAASAVTSARATAVDRERSVGGEEREVWALLDLVSRRGDALLTWSNDPWPYLKYQRVAATRFIWKSFLMGEIYLGRSSTSYVLPRSWTWFAGDLARSRPVAFIETNPRDKGTPFDTLISRRFTPVLSSGHNTVYLRADVARDLVSSGETTTWEPGTTIGSCERLEGRVTPGATGSVRFQFTDTTGQTEPLHLTLDGKQVSAGSDFVEYLALPSGITDPAQPSSFVLVIGRRAAALIVDGFVRGALRLPPSVTVAATGTGGPVDLSDLRIGRVSSRSGCSAVVRKVP